MVRRSQRTTPLISLSNSELSRQERSNRKNKATQATMAANDGNNAAAMAAAFQAMQQELADVRRQLNQHQPHPNPPQAPPPQPPIGAADRPHTFYTNRSAIVYPAVDRNDYELKPQLLALVDKTPFNGFPSENPMDHIERIERIAGFTRSNGVPPDFTLCKLFEFSLANRAIGWLNSLPPGSLIGWAAVRDAFLDHYFTKSKTATLRAKISTFQQNSGESFSEAWERFKTYKRDCPHHGFDDTQLVSIFYEGVNWDYKNQLNAASNGNFMTRDVEAATQLIENLAESSSDRSMEYDRKRSANAVDTEKMAELTNQLSEVKELLRSQQPQREVKFVEPEDNGQFENEEVNYVTGQGSKQGFYSNHQHPNLSYRNPNVANPQDQHYPPAVNPHLGANPTYRPYQGQGSSSQGQGQQGYNIPPYQPPPMRQYNAPRPPQYPPPQQQNDSSQDEIKGMLQLLIANSHKSEGRVDALATKLDALTTHVKTMDTQLAQQAEAIRRQPGPLPGRPEGNPRVEHVNTITLIRGTQLLSSEQTPANPSEVRDLAAFEESPDLGNFIAEENGGGQHRDAPTPAPPERVYIPKAPYPLHLYKPRVPALTKPPPPVAHPECVHVSKGELWPKMQHVVESMEAKEPITTDEERCAVILEECNVVLPSEMPPKLDDPGKYSIPVKIGLTDFPTSLCDLGSSVNLMPHSTAKKLGFTKLEPTNISLMFADRSLRAPLGILANVHVQVGHAVVPVDFVVLEIKDEPPEPLILGRPFLRTAGANIDVRTGIIELNIGPSVLHFQVGTLLDCRPPSAPDPYSIQDPRLVPVVPIDGTSEPPWRDKHDDNGLRNLIFIESHFGDPPRA